MSSIRSTIPALIAAAITAVSVDGQSVDTLALRGHTRFLASDSLAGRGTATAGERLAASYIASQLERLGLRPVGGDFLQPVPLHRVFVSPETNVVVQRGNDTVSFLHGRDFILAPGARDAYRSFSGEAVFVGTAEQAARVPASTLRGRVPVVLGTFMEAASVLLSWREAAVAGVILAVADSAQFDLIARTRATDRFFVDAPVDDPIWQALTPRLIAGPKLLRALLSQVRIPLAPSPGAVAVPLGRTVRADIVIRTQPAPAANLAAVLPGADAALRDEYIAYTAHYDHLGIGPPDERGDTIYNGFSDNAAGVAMLLAIADVLGASPPPRSVLFLFFTGEERGLLGSSYYATRPLVPLDRTVAVINLDAGAPPAPPVSWRIAGDSIPLGSLARDVARSRGWTAQLSPASPNSDYWPFIRRGTDAIFIVPGNEWENTTTEQRDALRRRWDRYHLPSDEWSPDFPFRGLERYAEYALEVGRAAARNLPSPRHR